MNVWINCMKYLFVSGFHIWSPNASMFSTLGAQMCLWFPHLEPKRVNGVHIWSPKASMVSTFGARTRQWFTHCELTLRDFTEIVLDTIDTFGLQMWKPLTRLGSKCGNRWRVWAPNVETIDTFGLPKWKPLTHLGSTLAPWRWLFSYFSGKKRGNQEFSPMNKWLFRSQLQHIKSFWNMIGSL